MRIVVTGASGFLGRVILDKLKSSKQDCIGVTRQNIKGLLHVPCYSKTPVGDVLVHLAEASDRKWVNQKGIKYEVKTKEVLNSLIRKKYKKILREIKLWIFKG